MLLGLARAGVTASLMGTCAVLLAGCNRISAGSGVDSMTNSPWAEIDMASPDYGVQLWVQCDGSETKVGVKATTHLTDEDGLDVMVKFPTDPTATDETWGTTTAHNGAIRNGDDTDFIKQLIASRSVQLRLSPIGSNVIDASFDTSRFAEKLAQYRDRCGWGQLLPAAPVAAPVQTSAPTPAPTPVASAPPPSAAPQISSAAPTPPSAANDSDSSAQPLITEVEALNNKCRGGSADDPATTTSCDARDADVEKLKALGWCFGTPDQAESEKTWVKCAGQADASATAQ